MSIIKQCMIVNLFISNWTGYRLDKEMTRKVTEDAVADSDAARVNKHLVPKESFKEVVSASGALRTHFYDKTLPWSDNGDRLLTRLSYMDFMAEHSRLFDDWKSAVHDFLTVKYPSARDQAAFRMGAMFKASDYPSPGELQYKFGVKLDISPVATANDFRVEMDQVTTDAIRAEIEQAMQDKVAGAMRDLWDRLSVTVNHFAATMDQEDKIFRDSTVKNLEDIVESLPALNFLNDPRLTEIGNDLKAAIIGYSPKELRKDAQVRQNAAREAQNIAAKMAGFMAAFKTQQ